MASYSSTSHSQPIKTVVVLVQENRSFDHMLGWMKPLNPEIDGVTSSESNPISTSDSNSNRVQFSDRSIYVDPDPGSKTFMSRVLENHAAKKLLPDYVLNASWTTAAAD
ncbi:non-specific phospholipase C3-like, partial [Trifolium medium]|nr:non-specific phospholipase C3-like [Trifolium medium]